MNFEIKDEKVILTPDTKEVIFGGDSLRQADYRSMLEASNCSEVLINLCNVTAVSYKGIIWLGDIAGDLRAKRISPFIIASFGLKNIIEMTEVGRLLEVFTSMYSEREDSKTVMSVEKDLLWGNLPDIE